MKLTIELTNKCLLDCIHCSSKNDTELVISLETINEVLKIYNISEIILSGGEPLLHPDFNEILEFLSKKYKVSLYTSGYCNSFNKDIFQKLEKIYISLYGKEDFHNSITQKDDSFERTIEFILKLLNEYKDKMIITTPIFDKRSEDIASILKELLILKEWLIPLHIIRLLPHGRAENIKVLNRESQLRIALEMQQEYFKTIISQSLFHEQCNFHKKVTLLPNGKLIGCVAMKHHPELWKEYVCDF